MDVLKAVLAARDDNSPEVLSLLDCLQSEEFALEVCVCSVGGVGSSQLHNFLTKHKFRLNLITDQDNLKHAHRPPRFAHGQSPKVIYLFGDPLLSIASHYRRGHAYHQAVKTSGNSRLREEDFPKTIQSYMARGEDLFGYSAHFNNWLSQQTDYSILFIRYETMFEPEVALQVFSYICQKLRTPDEAYKLSNEFCELYHPRSSQLPEDLPTQLYAELSSSMASLPDVFIRSPAGGVESVVY